MDNFDLRKYLAEGKLLKEEEEDGNNHIQHTPEIEKEIEVKKKLNKYPFDIRDEDGNLVHYQETKNKWVKYKNKGGKRVASETWTGFYNRR